MKNTKARILLLCIFSAILVSGVNFAATKPIAVGSTQEQHMTGMPATAFAGIPLTDGELTAIVGGETGCSASGGCYRCCVDFWIIEICAGFCLPW